MLSAFAILAMIHINTVRAITNGRITTWLDAQHQYAAIEQRAVQRPALYAVAAMAATAATAATGRTRPRPTPRRGAAAAGTAAAQGRAGREQVHPWCTRLPR